MKRLSSILICTLVKFALQLQSVQATPSPGRNGRGKELDLELSLLHNHYPNHEDTLQHHGQDHQDQEHWNHGWQDEQGNAAQLGALLSLSTEMAPDSTHGHFNRNGRQEVSYWNRMLYAMEGDSVGPQLNNHAQAVPQSSSHHGQYGHDPFLAPSFHHLSMYPTSLHPGDSQVEAMDTSSQSSQIYNDPQGYMAPYSMVSTPWTNSHISNSVGPNSRQASHEENVQVWKEKIKTATTRDEQRAL